MKSFVYPPLLVLAIAASCLAQVNVIRVQGYEPTLAPRECPCVDCKCDPCLCVLPIPATKPAPVSVVTHNPAAASVQVTSVAGRIHSKASATVIDYDGLTKTATVLTCWHVIEPNGRLYVGWPGAAKSLPAKLLRSNRRSDVALLTVVVPAPVAVTPVASQPLKSGEPATAFGFERGGPLRKFLTKITHTGRYSGFANQGIAGTPQQGRSGGGLFNLRGEVLGVCSAADGREGLYCGLAAIKAIVNNEQQNYTAATKSPPAKGAGQVFFGGCANGQCGPRK